MRIVLNHCLIVGVLLFTNLSAEWVPADDARFSRPNVLFIAIDDLNDMVGFLRNHPGVKTPNLDRLAARGVNFTNAHCAAPGCAASRTAMITGLRPSTTGNYVNADIWLKNPHTRDVITLPESFQKAGYETRGGGKIYHAYSFNEEALTGYLDPEPWDEFFPSRERQMPPEVTPDEWPVNSSKEFYGGRFDWAPLAIEDDEMADGQVVSWAEKQLALEHEKPLFLAVGIYRPHVPWWTPEDYFDLHPLDQVQLPKVLENDLEDVSKQGHLREWEEVQEMLRLRGFAAPRKLGNCSPGFGSCSSKSRRHPDANNRTGTLGYWTPNQKAISNGPEETSLEVRFAPHECCHSSESCA